MSANRNGTLSFSARGFAAILAFLWALSAAGAQLPQTRLAYVFPPGALAGTTNELSLSGTELQESTGLRFSDPRIIARSKTGATNVYLVHIPEEVAPGLVDVRVEGRFGISNPRGFMVGDLPEVIATGSNTTASVAMELAAGSVVSGRTEKNLAAWFRFAARSGERFIFRVASREIDSRLEPVLAVSTKTEPDLARSQQGWIEFIAPAEDAYFLQLHDRVFRGGDEYAYRLEFTTGPHLEFAVPSVFRAGETNHVILFGRNLPGGEPADFPDLDGRRLERLEIDLAPPSSLGPGSVAGLLRRPASFALADQAFAWRLPSTNGISNPLLFSVTTLPLSLGTFARTNNPLAPTNAAGSASLSKVVPPIEHFARFPRRGELSGVTFQAKKGDVLWIELWSERLGFPTDPFAVLQQITTDAKGSEQVQDVMELGDNDANSGGNEFNTTSRDPSARFEAKEDGTYRLQVRDLFNMGPGRPRYWYRLSLRPESPDFSLVALPQMPPKANVDDRSMPVVTPQLRRRETLPIRIFALRRDGFAGEIALTAPELPAGIRGMAARIPAGQNSASFLLTAGETLAESGPVLIYGEAVVGTNRISRRAVLAAESWPIPDSNNEVSPWRLCREPMLSVCRAESAPISVMPAENRLWETAGGGKLSIPLWVTRRGDFNGAFNLKLAGHPELDKVKETNIAEKATNGIMELSLAGVKLPEGTHTLWLQGTVAGKYRNNPEALAEAEAELNEAGKVLAGVSEAEKPRAEQRRKSAEERKKAAEERAKPRDVTLMVFSEPFALKVNPPPKPPEKK